MNVSALALKNLEKFKALLFTLEVMLPMFWVIGVAFSRTVAKVLLVSAPKLCFSGVSFGSRSLN